MSNVYTKLLLGENDCLSLEAVKEFVQQYPVDLFFEQENGEVTNLLEAAIFFCGDFNDDELALSVIRWLIEEAGANPKLLGPDGKGALHTAAFSGGFPETINYLVMQAGVPVDLHNDERVITPLLLAVDNGECDTVAQLIKLGACLDIYPSGSGPIDIIINDILQYNEFCIGQRTEAYKITLRMLALLKTNGAEVHPAVVKQLRNYMEKIEKDEDQIAHAVELKSVLAILETPPVRTRRHSSYLTADVVRQALDATAPGSTIQITIADGTEIKITTPTSKAGTIPA